MSVVERNQELLENIKRDIGDIYRNQLSRVNVTVWMETDDGDEQVISLYDVYQDLFKVGDVIYVNIEELYPKDIKQYREEFKQSFTEENERRIKLFHRKWVKLISRGIYVHSEMFRKDRIEIEYFCEFSDKPKK